MYKELLEEWAEYQRDIIASAIEKKLKRQLDKKTDVIKLVWQAVNLPNVEDPVFYGAVVLHDVVYGALHVNWAEPCIEFTPNRNLLP